jgi:glycosyltransferase involved in cell wall biosynthesis
LQIGVDATSLAGPRSGVGQTAYCLIEALVQVDEGLELVAMPIGSRTGRKVRRALPHRPHVRAVRAVPRQVADLVWSRAEWPPAELFCGHLDVFWGPNVSLPPLVKAAGVATIHDLAFIEAPELIADADRRRTEGALKTIARASRIVVPSEFVARSVERFLPDEAPRVRVVRPGVRRVFRERGSVLTPPRRAALGIEDPYAVFVGDLGHRKNVETLLRAFDLSRAVHPEAQLVLIGRGQPGWDAIAERCARVMDAGAVRVLGYLPDEEVAAIVRGARVFCYPSRYEGFGITPLEAMVAGTPVIAAKTSALGETLGDHARFVHPDDVEGIASAIADHFEGEPDAGELEAARSYAAGFTWADAALTLLDVFDEAIAEAS